MDNPETLPHRGAEFDAGEIERQLGALNKLSARFGASISQAFVDASLKGKSFGDTLATLALKLSELTLKSVFSPLTGQLGGGLAGLLSPSAMQAAGAALPIPFAQGGVIASPVGFPFAGGRTAVAGEAGPEAILPLARGPDGSLGVRAGQAAGAGMSITFNIATPDAESFRRSQSQISAMLARAVAQGQRNL